MYNCSSAVRVCKEPNRFKKKLIGDFIIKGLMKFNSVDKSRGNCFSIYVYFCVCVFLFWQKLHVVFSNHHCGIKFHVLLIHPVYIRFACSADDVISGEFCVFILKCFILICAAAWGIDESFRDWILIRRKCFIILVAAGFAYRLHF